MSYLHFLWRVIIEPAKSVTCACLMPVPPETFTLVVLILPQSRIFPQRSRHIIYLLTKVNFTFSGRRRFTPSVAPHGIAPPRGLGEFSYTSTRVRADNTPSRLSQIKLLIQQNSYTLICWRCECKVTLLLKSNCLIIFFKMSKTV